MAFRILFVLFAFGTFTLSAQTEDFRTQENVQNISIQTAEIRRTLDSLNKKLDTFSQTFSSNQGLKLTEKQQNLLFAFEMLNRAETRLSTLQLLRVQLADREATARRRIDQIDDEMRAENIDRTIGGTTNAEQVRTTRRNTLQNERNNRTRLLAELQESMREAESEIRSTEQFLRSIRNKIFPEVLRELSDL